MCILSPFVSSSWSITWFVCSAFLSLYSRYCVPFLINTLLVRLQIPATTSMMSQVVDLCFLWDLSIFFKMSSKVAPLCTRSSHMKSMSMLRLISVANPPPRESDISSILHGMVNPSQCAECTPLRWEKIFLKVNCALQGKISPKNC